MYIYIGATTPRTAKLTKQYSQTQFEYDPESDSEGENDSDAEELWQSALDLLDRKATEVYTNILYIYLYIYFKYDINVCLFVCAHNCL